MPKAAIVILAGTENGADMGRAVNALETAKEFAANSEDVKIVFDGAGTQWVGELSSADHPYHDLYESVKDSVDGACAYCADAYDAEEAVREEGIDLLDDHDGHPSMYSLVKEGYEVITF